jgi:hypothetical protein
MVPPRVVQTICGCLLQRLCPYLVKDAGGEKPALLQIKQRQLNCLRARSPLTQLSKQRFNITPLNVAANWPGKNEIECALVLPLHACTVP